MSVSLFDLKAQNSALEPELQEAFLRVLHSGQFILGPEVEKFEKALAEFTGAKYALAVSSGTDAILLALMTLGIGPGDKIFVDKLPDGRIAVQAARPTGKISDVFGMLKRDGQKAISIEEMNEIIADGWTGKK